MLEEETVSNNKLAADILSAASMEYAERACAVPEKPVPGAASTAVISGH